MDDANTLGGIYLHEDLPTIFSITTFQPRFRFDVRNLCPGSQPNTFIREGKGAFLFSLSHPRNSLIHTSEMTVWRTMKMNDLDLAQESLRVHGKITAANIKKKTEAILAAAHTKKR